MTKDAKTRQGFHAPSRRTLALIAAVAAAAFLLATGRETTFFEDHRSHIVSTATEKGESVGFVIGLPLDLVLLPISDPLANKIYPNGGEGQGYILLYPSYRLAGALGELTGGLAWLGFGWWAPPEEQSGTRLGPRTPSSPFETTGTTTLHCD